MSQSENHDKAATLTRDGTMDATAKEGLEYLKNSGSSFLVRHVQEACGEKNNDEPPKVARDGTMAATAKEGKAYLKEVWNYDEDGAADGKKDDDVPDVKKHTTMKRTIEEATELLKDFKEGEGRNSTPEERRQTLKKQGTMEATIAEGNLLLAGSDVGAKRSRSPDASSPEKRQRTEENDEANSSDAKA